MLIAAAVIAAAAIGYLYTRLTRIQPATLIRAESVARETGKATAALARLIAITADVLRSFNPPHLADTEFASDVEGDFID